MKILIATGIFPPEIGGPATYAGLLRDELKKRGDQVIVLPFREVRQYPKLLRHLVYFFKVVSLSSKVDVIFTQDPVSTGVPVVCAAFFTRKRVVMRVAGDYAWEQSTQRYGVTESIDDFQKRVYSGSIEFLRTLQRFSVRHTDVVVTPSKYFSKLVGGWLGDSREVMTIYNGIDLSIEFKKEAKYPTKTMITAGRMVPWKGFDTLIRDLKDMPEWNLLIAGDGPDKERLMTLAQDCEVKDRVTFLGQLDRSDLLTRINSSHVFVLLSTFESFSFQIVEAMHVGVPVIAANIGNLSEIIDNGVSGVLLDPTDIELFKKTAARFISDQAYTESISIKAKVRASDFTIANTIDQVRAVFESVVSNPKK